MAHIKALVFLLALSGSLFAQGYEHFGSMDGVRLAEKLMNHPVIRKDEPEPMPVFRYEMRVFVPKYDYAKPVKRRLIEVVPEVGDSHFYLYEVAGDKLTRVSAVPAKPRKFALEVLDESWDFVCSSAYASVRVD